MSEMVKVRFTRSFLRYAAGDTATVDCKVADGWCRRRVCVPEPGEQLQEVAVLEQADVRTADLTPKRRAKR